MLSNVDLIALITFLVCFALYHGTYLIVAEKRPDLTLKARMRILREKSIINLLKREEYDAVIQLLRGLIMAGNVFASSSLIFMGLLLNLLINIDKVTRNLGIVDVYGFEFKLLFIIGLQALSFMLFVSSIRYYRMISLLVATPQDEISRLFGVDAERYYGQLMDKGSTYYTLGSRCLLYSMISFSWFVSTPVFIALTVGITLLLANYRDFVR